MTGMRRVSNEVLTATDAIVRVTAHDLVGVVERSLRSPRKRARFCAHRDPTDALHEMLICLAQGTYVRPHRHTGKSESFHIIEGELDVVLFHDDGAIREVVRMGSYGSGKTFFYRLALSCFHTVLVNTTFALFHETTNGPFCAEDAEFAPWAPTENTPTVAAYLDGVRMTINHGITGAA